MGSFANLADIKAIEAEKTWEARGAARSIHEFLSRAKAAHGARPAVSYQLTSGPQDASETLTWADLHARTTQAANLFRSLGVGERDVVGEMAALDPQPRSARVSALQEALLLRLTDQDLDLLMSEDAEVARAIIQTLCRRLRHARAP